jgi:hypothetical protein
LYGDGVQHGRIQIASERRQFVSSNARRLNVARRQHDQRAGSSRACLDAMRVIDCESDGRGC